MPDARRWIPTACSSRHWHHNAGLNECSAKRPPLAGGRFFYSAGSGGSARALFAPLSPASKTKPHTVGSTRISEFAKTSTSSCVTDLSQGSNHRGLHFQALREATSQSPMPCNLKVNGLDPGIPTRESGEPLRCDGATRPHPQHPNPAAMSATDRHSLRAEFLKKKKGQRIVRQPFPNSMEDLPQSFTQRTDPPLFSDIMGQTPVSLP